eukprot:TRINITY_DN3152_c0_g1_i15.p1 TRINITY_DN3152_c0_g1~~TRINITY_DN3152_c0_g1_i15.p1  ORF type:complete len:147 (+),score=32.56 TRINITY_DN3152_c0_g1_i15:413-853(+)
MLREYGPTVPEALLNRLAQVFRHLRAESDAGLLAYPYSTRELVNIVRHINAYPNDGIIKTLHNVFEFDKFDAATLNQLKAIFVEHGIPLDMAHKPKITLAPEVPLPPAVMVEQWSGFEGGYKAEASVTFTGLEYKKAWDWSDSMVC